MKVVKRSGAVSEMLFDKVTCRIQTLNSSPEFVPLNVQPDKVAQKAFSSLFDGISTSEIDNLTAEVAVSMITENPDYETLAMRIIVSNLQKTCPPSFSDAMVALHVAGVVSDHFMKCLSTEIDTWIVHSRDYLFGYFGIKTLQKGYLNVGETPQYLFMRVAIGIHGDDYPRVRETYDLMSRKTFTHATPTLFNAGTKNPQMSSCFVAGTPVFTTNRGPVPIEQVQIDDIVITHTGAAKPVVQLHTNPLGDRTLFDIKVYKTPGVKVTGNHRFWSITKEQLNWREKPQWNSIDQIRVGDWISIPKSTASAAPQVLDMYDVLKELKGAEHWQYSFDFADSKMRRNTHFTSAYRPNGVTKPGEWFERYITLNEEFAWFLGSWYGDGCILFQKSSARTQTHRGIAFAQNPNNTEFVNEIVRIGEKYLGVHACVSEAKTQNCVSISFNNSAIGNAFNILFGRWSSEKFLYPGIFSWSRGMVAALLGGLVSTDGCCTLNGGVVLQLTNQPLIQSIFHVARSVGIDVSMTIMTKLYNGRDTYIGRMSIPWIPEIMKWVRKHYDDDRFQKSERANSTLEIDGQIFLRVNGKSKVTDDLPTFVYTLGVKDDHSYSVAGLIAENCFLVAMKEDSVEGIFETLKECAHISKWSGGIGLHCHNIRANGSVIKGTNGKSDGIVPMLRVYNNTARYINQGGGKRKGSFAVYLEPWHADIMEFLELRLNQGDEEARCRDIFTAMWIPDLFMEKVEADAEWHLMCPSESPGLADVWGEAFNELYRMYVAQGRFRRKVRARDIWDAILKSQVETGTPYMLYKDACNSKSNQQNIGTIKSSNLCVAPETKILTRDGYKQISTIENERVEVWNGHEWSWTKVVRTSESARLIRVNFSDGTFLDCTHHHKFHLQVGYRSKSEIKDAQSLIPGDKLIKWTPPAIIDTKYTQEPFKYAYTHGFFCGDGTYHATYSGNKTIPGVALYGEKKKLVRFLNVRSMSGIEDAQGRLNVMLPSDLLRKFAVPGSEITHRDRLEWFAGLCDADGHVQGCPGNPTQKSISVASIHLNFLREIQLMLHTLGATSVIGQLHVAGETELPDGHGGKKMFNVQPCWRLVVCALGVEALIKAGLVTHRLDLGDFTAVSRDVRQYVRVVSIEDNGRTDATYCFNEPKRHMGVFNGIIAGNCTEIVEVSGPDETAVCNLASLSLPAFVKDGAFDFVALASVTRVVTRNLNRVIDRNFYPTEAARKSNMRHRPIAIGVQGLADVFMMLGLAFDEPEARDLNKRIFAVIYGAALLESCELAKADGPYETFAGSPASKGILQFDMWNVQCTIGDWEPLKQDIMKHGLRNSLLVAPMPTASTAQILGNNEAFEPYTTNIYLRRTLAGEFVMVNKHLVKDLQSLDMWTPHIKNEIVRNGGSVQHIEGLPDKLKAIYRTVWEISQKSILDMAADRGAYIDQSQSLNIFVENPTLAKLSSMHMYGWKKGLKTGMYYLRTRAKAKPIQVTVPFTAADACRRDNPEACMMCSS